MGDAAKGPVRCALLDRSEAETMVRVEGIEPPRLAAGDFESPASTNSAIPARVGLFA